MAKSCQWVSNMKMSILLKKGFSYVRVSLKKRRISHLSGSAHFTIPLRGEVFKILGKGGEPYMGD